MVQLSRHLGFGPYNLSEIATPFVADEPEQKILEQLLITNYEKPIAMTQTQRRSLLDVLLRFYSTHMDNFGEVRSLAVVRELIN